MLPITSVQNFEILRIRGPRPPPPQGRGPRPRAHRKLAPQLAPIVAIAVSQSKHALAGSPRMPAHLSRLRVALRRPPIGRRLRALLPAAADGERQRNAASEPADAAHVRERSRISVSRDLASRKSAARNTCKSRGSKHETPGARGACRRGSCRQCWRTPAYTRCTQPLASCMVASVACSMHLAFACVIAVEGERDRNLASA